MTYNIENTERTIISTYIFEPVKLETTILQPNHITNLFYKELFFTILQLQKEMIPIDEVFIEKKMGIKFDANIYIDLISANPISNVKAYEYQLIQLYNEREYTINLKKIENDESLSFVEKVNKLKELSEKTTNTLSSNLFNVKNTSTIIAKTPKFFLKDKLPIQEQEITMISGKGGGGKSFVALWLASMLTKEKLKVFAYLSEDSVENSKNRLNILKKTTPELLDFDIMGKDCRPQAFISKEGQNFTPSEYFYQFKAKFSFYDIIILDPLIAFILEDENNNVEARFLFNILNEWCVKEKKTIIALHHHNKGDEVRGASAFIDAVRLHYTINKDKDNDTSRFLKIEKTNHYAGKTNFEIKLFEDEFKNDFDKEAIHSNNEDVRIII